MWRVAWAATDMTTSNTSMLCVYVLVAVLATGDCSVSPLLRQIASLLGGQRGRPSSISSGFVASNPMPQPQPSSTPRRQQTQPSQADLDFRFDGLTANPIQNIGLTSGIRSDVNPIQEDEPNVHEIQGSISPVYRPYQRGTHIQLTREPPRRHPHIRVRPARRHHIDHNRNRYDGSIGLISERNGLSGDLSDRGSDDLPDHDRSDYSGENSYWNKHWIKEHFGDLDQDEEWEKSDWIIRRSDEDPLDDREHNNIVIVKPLPISSRRMRYSGNRFNVQRYGPSLKPQLLESEEADRCIMC